MVAANPLWGHLLGRNNQLAHCLIRAGVTRMVKFLTTLSQAKTFLNTLSKGQGISGRTSAPHTPCVKAGFLPGATYPNGTPVAAIAAAQEFGAVSHHKTGHGYAVQVTPPRPFLRPAMQQDAPHWAKVFQQAFVQNYSVLPLLHAQNAALQATGAAMQASIVRAIQAVQTPPNAPSTLWHKKTQKPLVESGRLLKNVSYTVQS